MLFIEMPMFSKRVTFTDEELRAMQNRLLDDPAAGALIASGHGLRKLRVTLPGRGKRGGARVIYYWRVNPSICYLVFAYPKNVMDDLTETQLKTLAQVMATEVDNG
jgi:hypothetical protein